ncbi:MAG: Coenzyme F420 hydrogenase/dehydrogenase, beta subunit C-terminal domain [Candidatus Hydrothermarchaeales archaeon]
MAVTEDEILQCRWLGREEGFTALEHEVVFRDLCCGCGACAAVCPDKVLEVDEFPKLTGKCTECGYCLVECPRTFFDPEGIEEKLYGKVEDQDLLGHIEVKVAARATNGKIRKVGQDGAFVTALLTYCLEKKLIDGAIVSGFNEDWKPSPMLVTSPKELMKSGGTRYSNCASLSSLQDAKEKCLKKLAVVGLPCQIEGIRKIQHYPIEDVDLKGRIELTIGLFCKSNFLYEGLMRELLQKKYKLNLKKMKKIDIKGKKVIAYTEKGEVEIPLKEAHEHERKGCKVCWDFTSRLSDFSVGSVGTPSGYTTVLARTKKAAKILKNMEKDKALEIMKLDDVSNIENLQNYKEKQAVKATRRRIREVLPSPYKHLKF